MTKQQLKTKRGFTIIEVVLVLAIAGLIFMMVFLALPALQRSQRDTQRRDDMSRVVSQIQQYMSNNRGAVPASPADVTNLMNNYLRSNGDEFKDPDGEEYTMTYMGSMNDASAPSGDDALPFDHEIRYYIYATCSPSAPENVEKSTGARKAAIRYKLENAGIYCANV